MNTTLLFLISDCKIYYYSKVKVMMILIVMDVVIFNICEFVNGPYYILKFLILLISNNMANTTPVHPLDEDIFGNHIFVISNCKNI